jgi:hypothetical protein
VDKHTARQKKEKRREDLFSLAFSLSSNATVCKTERLKQYIFFVHLFFCLLPAFISHKSIFLISFCSRIAHKERHTQKLDEIYWKITTTLTATTTATFNSNIKYVKDKKKSFRSFVK